MAIVDPSVPPEPATSDAASFEDAYRELQDVITRLEVGGLGLAESLRLYERGVALARRCEGIVAAAELRVTRLQADGDESLADDAATLLNPVAQDLPF